MSVRRRGIVLALGLLLAALPAAGRAQPACEDGAFGISVPAFHEHFQAHGGCETFGQPISRAFVLQGRVSQLFQSGLFQLGSDGQVQVADLPRLLGTDLATILPQDGSAADGAPRPGELLRAVLLGEGLPEGLALALAASPLWRQYDPIAARGPLRPWELTDSLLDGALVPSRAADRRVGVIVAGPRVEPFGVAAALADLGAGAWYSFDDRPGPSDGRALLVRPADDLAQVAALARQLPGSAWLIGNEPNVPGQDDLDPVAYADFLAAAAAVIRQADPLAGLVGPNVLNWDATCVGCPGYTSGRSWSQAFVQAYVERHGPLPLDAWGMHAYSLDWSRLPLADAPTDQAQVRAARAWLDAAGLDLPLWLTEFGVVWGYDDIAWVRRADGSFLAHPRGTYRADVLATYLDEMLGWLVEQGPALRVQRWFLYATRPPSEPYASRPAGLALLEPDSSLLTPAGERFRAWALRAQSPPATSEH